MGDLLRPTRIETKRLVLAPLDEELARAVLIGDFSVVTRADGWPHDDTLDAMRMATAPGGGSLVWLVLLGDVVIGECGTVGGLDDAGAIEVGYGLAAEYRGRGYGNELVGALSGWLMAQPGVEQVVAREVLADNVASRRALENAGFLLEREEGGLTWYALRDQLKPNSGGRMTTTVAAHRAKTGK
jgi:RimJ/RimL family protein N-acetyltransferase